MQVSREEILHIANLANLKLQDEELDTYLVHLQDILNFAEKVNNAPTDGLGETIGANDKYNVFRKDEIVQFGDREALLQNAPEQERGMFKIPKVIQ
ncbi:MAG: Asp-tRNA(Asn)/Glu-tRNA(Gln) amidotransferase subunit GatC [Clostridia bacterium]|nr:Asp-tRNA(Asn)/Glu-tRNA(Gln) amidotransferase subunit GatC [Clostridia bacterium]